jgi:hypothetical protein
MSANFFGARLSAVYVPKRRLSHSSKTAVHSRIAAAGERTKPVNRISQKTY